MKKIGLIGGMSWESTLVYYQLLNIGTKESLGDTHSCRCIIESLDFHEIQELQHLGEWDKLERLMVECAVRLEDAGAEIILLCTNTMHFCVNKIQESINAQFMHIASATGNSIYKMGLKRILLLGTMFTMEQKFYSSMLEENYGITCIIPDTGDMKTVHNVIYDELVKGVLNDRSRKELLTIIKKSVGQGAEGVILGCTELPLLIKASDLEVPIFDTTQLHVEYALTQCFDTSEY